MSITYTVREVHPDHLVVDYSDGSFAEVPIDVSMSEPEIELAIKAYGNPPTTPFADASAVPVKVGDTGQVDPPAPAQQSEATVNGIDIRTSMYPAHNELMEALQLKESGDSAMYNQLMADVEGINQAFPKNMVMTQSDFNKMLEAKANA